MGLPTNGKLSCPDCCSVPCATLWITKPTCDLVISGVPNILPCSTSPPNGFSIDLGGIGLGSTTLYKSSPFQGIISGNAWNAFFPLTPTFSDWDSTCTTPSNVNNKYFTACGVSCDSGFTVMCGWWKLDIIATGITLVGSNVITGISGSYFKNNGGLFVTLSDISAGSGICIGSDSHPLSCSSYDSLTNSLAILEPDTFAPHNFSTSGSITFYVVINIFGFYAPDVAFYSGSGPLESSIIEMFTDSFVPSTGGTGTMAFS